MPGYTYTEAAGDRKLAPQAVSELRPSRATGKSQLEERAEAYKARRGAPEQENQERNDNLIWSDPSLAQEVNRVVRGRMSLSDAVSGRFGSPGRNEANGPRSPSVEQIRRGSERSEIRADGVMRQIRRTVEQDDGTIVEVEMPAVERTIPHMYTMSFPQSATLSSMYGTMDSDATDSEETSDAPEATEATPEPVQVQDEQHDSADLPQEQVRELMSTVAAQALAASAAMALNSEVQQERSSTLLALRNALRRIS